MTKASRSVDAESAIDWLRRAGSKANRIGMARFAIPSDRAFGVRMPRIQAYAKQIGRQHELAAELWKSGWYEARLLAAYVDDPSQVTPAQMDAWCKDFDNWAVCDTLCFALFDRTPHAWKKVTAWARRKDEYVKRAGFALLWGLTVHDKSAPNARYVEGLALIEKHATDERYYVKKAINMALRAVGKRNAVLHAEASSVAKRLAASTNVAARWVGSDALRELSSASVLRRVANRGAKSKRSV